MTQSEIAAAIGRSQPEVSRLLRFHGTTPLARKLRRNSEAIRHLVTQAGGARVRVFGSVAAGTDEPGSDVDLLFAMRRPLSLMQLGRLEHRSCCARCSCIWSQPPHAGNEILDQLIIDAICMRLSAGIEVLARVETLARTDLFGDSWQFMWGMRNRIAHGYLLVDSDIVRQTVDVDLPTSSA